ncbi:ABC transporter ATP-binding protein [Microbulbifer guangxiensis]|uniref:ABC transporter ATP-binding protein n=1 Tax=Microbulbifer guangxiensis TaxID=2904249 RepID=UPI001F22CB7E|nr:ABC transporter ATP-binding protein [Microbulbifer guangxiensis]
MASGALTLDRIKAGNLQPVSEKIAPGEILCLSGPSGSGKSRLLRAVADLDPHEGSVSIAGESQQDLRGHRWRRAVMMVPADSAWWFETVGEHMPAPMTEALKQLGFDEDVSRWSIERLSSGEKQRLALVRALAYQPRALLLDEPTANLDPDATRETEQWLCQVIRERSLPTLWVAHDREQIKRVADRHLHIEGDRLVESSGDKD